MRLQRQPTLDDVAELRDFLTVRQQDVFTGTSAPRNRLADRARSNYDRDILHCASLHSLQPRFVPSLLHDPLSVESRGALPARGCGTGSPWCRYLHRVR